MPPKVPCPKCRGGCDLCGSTGQVNEIVARVYLREESRKTAKMTRGRLEAIWSEEAPTRPEILKSAARRATIGLYVLVVTAAAAIGVAIGALARACY